MHSTRPPHGCAGCAKPGAHTMHPCTHLLVPVLPALHVLLELALPLQLGLLLCGSCGLLGPHLLLPLGRCRLAHTLRLQGAQQVAGGGELLRQLLLCDRSTLCFSARRQLASLLRQRGTALGRRDHRCRRLCLALRLLAPLLLCCRLALHCLGLGGRLGAGPLLPRRRRHCRSPAALPIAPGSHFVVLLHALPQRLYGMLGRSLLLQPPLGRTARHTSAGRAVDRAGQRRDTSRRAFGGYARDKRASLLTPSLELATRFVSCCALLWPGRNTSSSAEPIPAIHRCTRALQVTASYRRPP